MGSCSSRIGDEPEIVEIVDAAHSWAESTTSTYDSVEDVYDATTPLPDNVYVIKRPQDYISPGRRFALWTPSLYSPTSADLPDGDMFFGPSARTITLTSSSNTTRSNLSTHSNLKRDIPPLVIPLGFVSDSPQSP
jgi:hypothetical protein